MNQAQPVLLPVSALLRPAAAALVLAAAAGCTSGGDPGVSPPSPTAQAAEICREFAAELPNSLTDLKSRATDPASDFTAAWGDPAVKLRCGVPRPVVLTPGSADYNPTADTVRVNEVDWLIEEDGDGYRFTTTKRRVFIEVTVPGKYAPEVNALTGLARAVQKTNPGAREN